MLSRVIDELGRISIPFELRREIGLNEKDVVEIFVQDNSLVIKKSISSCIFCGSIEKLRTIKKKCICDDCLQSASAVAVGVCIY